MLVRVLIVLGVAHAVAIYAFVRGFLLTRIHLPLEEYSSVDGDICPNPYKKLVWIVVDALRYDFVVDDGRYHFSGRHADMPFLSSLVHSRNNDTTSRGAKVFRFIADAPTTTTQRLKSMTTGGLPVFFDVSNAFSASPVDEDNLINQLHRSGKYMIFMGDSTWDGLYPTQFNQSHPFPCYNIMDLDSVDDGIDELLLPTIKQHDDQPWDVLIAHYLGVDHAGHAHGVESDSMKAKLRRLDDSVRNVVETLHQEGYSDTLVLVMGDHGQTLTGDHGGGSPEEVDSVLAAIDIDAFYRKTDSNHHSWDGEENCTSNCSCGEEGNQCVPDLMQIDFVPTLAGFMNIPIPFVNLGRVSRSLWSLIERDRCTSSFMKILKANAHQVYKYLHTYAHKPGARFPSSVMQKMQENYHLLEERNDITEQNYLEFLGLMEQSARNIWTQFHEGWMLSGLAIFFLVLIFQCSVLYVNILSIPKFILNESLAVWLCSLIHPIGIFSFFFLLGEGLYLSYLVLVIAMVLFLFRMMKATKPSHWLLASKAFLLVTLSCFFISKFGLQSHSGFSFWQRLTVHDGKAELTEIRLREYVSKHLSNLFLPDTFSHLNPKLVDFGIYYIFPSLILLYWEDLLVTRALKRCRIDTALSRVLMYLGFISMLMYHWALHVEGWRDVSLKELIHADIFSQPNIIFPDESLEILFPSMCFGSVVSLVAFATVRRKMGSISCSSSLILFRIAASILVLLISPIMTPLIMLGLYSQIYGLYWLQGDKSGTGIHWLPLTACMSVIQSQAFFISGHLCEFSGLLYTAAFVGQKDYDLLRSGLLLGFDTCGCMIVVMLTNLSLSLDLPTTDSPHDKNKSAKKRKHSCSRFSPDKMNKLVRASDSSDQILGSFVIFGLSRSLICFSAMISAGIQRRHLYAWALFAPKFVFEIFFLSITYVVLIFVSFLV